MKYFFIFSLLIITSCTSIKYSHNHFADCEKKFSKFTDISTCALKEIQEDCNNNSLNCQNEKSRFVITMKRLQIMVDNNEISDNEAMFRYYNLIDFEESKFKTIRNMHFSDYQYYPNNYYFRGTPSCYFSGTSFCY